MSFFYYEQEGEKYKNLKKLLEDNGLKILSTMAVTDIWQSYKIVDKEYSLAEKYYEILGEYADKKGKKNSYYLRMYFLSLNGQEQNLNLVKQEYRQLVIKETLEKDERFEDYLKWLAKSTSGFKNEK